MSRKTISSVLDKFHPLLYDPHLFLACSSKTETLNDVDIKGDRSVYHVATADALANAALLQIQLQEICQALAPQLEEGEQLSEFWHGPLKQLLADKSTQNQLAQFRKANSASLPQCCKEEGFVDPFRASFRPRPGLPYGLVRSNFRPLPLTAFCELAVESYKALAQPRTNNRVEGVFSIASGGFRAGKRNTKPQMWSAIIRKKNVWNLNLDLWVKTKQFFESLALYLSFCRRFSQLIRKVYEPDLGESELKMAERMKSDMPQYATAGGAFETTNICDADESSKVLIAPDRNGGAEQNKRHRGVDNAPRPPVRRRRAASDDLLSHHAEESIGCDGREASIADREEDSAEQFNNLGSGADVQDASRMELGLADGANSRQSLSLVADSEGAKGQSVVSESHAPDETDAEKSRMKRKSVVDTDDDVPLFPSNDLAKRKDPLLTEDDDAGCGTAGADNSKVVNVEGGLSLYEDIEPDDDIDPSILDALEASMHKAEASMNKALDEDGQESDSDEEGAPKELLADRYPDVLRRNVGKFKREYAEAIAMSPSWNRCQIEEIKTTRKGSSLEPGTTISYVRLKRSDEVVFRATPGGQLSYILRTAAGPQLINLERIFHPVNSTEVMISYTRVLCSSDAVAAADRSEDLVEFLTSHTGQDILSRRSGSEAIQRQLQGRRNARKPELYHWGDICFQSKAVDLVGAVYWIPLVEEQAFAKPSTNAFRTRTLTSLQSMFSPLVKQLDTMDRVVLGEPFSELRH